MPRRQEFFTGYIMIITQPYTSKHAALSVGQERLFHIVGIVKCFTGFKLGLLKPCRKKHAALSAEQERLSHIGGNARVFHWMH